MTRLLCYVIMRCEREARAEPRASPPRRAARPQGGQAMKILTAKQLEPKHPLDALMEYIYSVGEALLEDGRAPTDAEIAKYDELVAANETPAFSPNKLDRGLEGRM